MCERFLRTTLILSGVEGAYIDAFLCTRQTEHKFGYMSTNLVKSRLRGVFCGGVQLVAHRVPLYTPIRHNRKIFPSAGR